jgi:hypothetical protein
MTACIFVFRASSLSTRGRRWSKCIVLAICLGTLHLESRGCCFLQIVQALFCPATHSLWNRCLKNMCRSGSIHRRITLHLTVSSVFLLSVPQFWHTWREGKEGAWAPFLHQPDFATAHIEMRSQTTGKGCNFNNKSIFVIGWLCDMVKWNFCPLQFLT